jgi:hypothetical protein
MKRTILTITIFLSMGLTTAAYSQTGTDLRPKWTKTVPNPPAGANYFLGWGVGEGSSEQDAINDAWGDVLQRSLNELGVVGISQQDIDAVKKNGIDAVVSFNKLKRRLLCSTGVIQMPNDRLKVYILIQVQRDVNGNDDFYDADNTICNDPAFDKKLKTHNAKMEKERIKKEKKKIKAKAPTTALTPQEQNNEGCKYEMQRKYAKAADCYRQSALQGNYARAQYNLGLLYEFGYGVKKDKEEAKMWYRAAAAQGVREAMERLKTF